MLSVVIPVYQAEMYLPRLLRSLDQAPNWEVVIVDDGSTDGTAQVAEEWLSGRANGQLIRLAHTTPGHARQVGLESALGEFLAYADADDQVVPPVLDRGCQSLDELSADVFIAGYGTTQEMDHAVSAPNEYAQIRTVPIRRVLTARAAVWGKVYRRSFLCNHGVAFPSLRSADDVVFSWRLATARPIVIETEDIGYIYWVAPHGQLTQDPDYYRRGISSLAELRSEARHSDWFGRLLGGYAYWTGAMHILRRSDRRERPRLGVKALGSFVMPGSSEMN